MNNVVRLLPPTGGSKTTRKPAGPAAQTTERHPSLRPLRHGDLSGVAQAHGFKAFAVLDIGERRGGLVFPKMSFHSLEEGLAAQIGSISDLTQCSVFLMLGETNIPFPFTTGLDCRTNEPPDPSLLDNQLDTLLNMFGLKGGYCVPVCDPNARRSVVMYFGVRDEMHSRYPGLVIDTIETFDAIWNRQAAGAVRPDLTSLELTCIAGLVHGRSYGDLAREMALSETTVTALTRSLTRKLGASSLHEAIHKAALLGLAGRQGQ